MTELVFNKKIELTYQDSIVQFNCDIVRSEIGIELRLIEKSNAFSLFICTISQSDFYLLKKEQNLLVDFERFVKILVNMFYNSSKYNLIFSSNILKFIENTEFKNIIQLELKFVKPTELQFKNYLGDILKRMESDNIKLLKENSILREKNAVGDSQLKEKISFLDSELKEYRRRNEDFERNFRNYESNLKIKTSECEKYSLKSERLENEVSQLRSELNKYTADNSITNKEKLRRKEEEVEELQAEIETANEIIRKSRKELSELKSTRKEYENRKEEESVKNKEILDKYNTIKDRVKGLEEKCKRHKEDIKLKDNKIKELEAKNKSLTKNLENMQSVNMHLYSKNVDEKEDSLSDSFSLRPESPHP